MCSGLSLHSLDDVCHLHQVGGNGLKALLPLHDVLK